MRLLLDSSIRPLYDARGPHPRGVSARSTSNAGHDVDGVVVTVAVNEGAILQPGQVRSRASTPPSGRELQKTANFQAEDIANFDEIKAGLERICRRYPNQGLSARDRPRGSRRSRQGAQSRSGGDRSIPGRSSPWGNSKSLGLDITTRAGDSQIVGVRKPARRSSRIIPIRS